MQNDKRVYSQMKKLQKEVDGWIMVVDGIGNQCAMTDRRLEKVLEVSKKVGRLYEKQFKY